MSSENNMVEFDEQKFEDGAQYSWKCLFRINSMQYTCPEEKDKKMLLYLDVHRGDEVIHSEPKVGVASADDKGVFVWNKHCTKKGKAIKLPLAFYVELDKEYSLKMKIKKKGGTPLVFTSYTDVHVFTMELNSVINKQLKNRKETEGKHVVMALQTELKGERLFTLNCTIMKFERVDCKLKMESVLDFSSHTYETVEWGQVAVDHINDEDVKQHPEVRISEQRFLNVESEGESSPLFTSRVIHSLPLRLAAVQVLQDSNVVAVSHLIGFDQLAKLEYSLDTTTMRDAGGRAMLIKNKSGDWAVVTAHWEGFKKKTKKESGDPGFLQLDFCDLKNKKTVHNLAFFTQEGKSRFINIAGMRLNMDLTAGEIVIQEGSKDTPEKIALALSVLTLFVLCEPRDGVDVKSIKYGYSSSKYEVTQGQKTKYNYYELSPWENQYLWWCGYNEDTCSNSHLYVASKYRGKPLHMWHLHGEEDVEEMANLENTSTDSYWTKAPEENEKESKVFCPWISDSDESDAPVIVTEVAESKVVEVETEEKKEEEQVEKKEEEKETEKKEEEKEPEKEEEKKEEEKEPEEIKETEVEVTEAKKDSEEDKVTTEEEERKESEDTETAKEETKSEKDDEEAKSEEKHEESSADKDETKESAEPEATTVGREKGDGEE